MKKIIFTALIFLILISSAYCDTNPYSKRVLELSASGKVTVIPDTAILTLGVNTEGSAAKIAQKRNFFKLEKLLSFLKEQGISEKNIKLSALKINPVYDKGRKNVLKYRAVSRITVKLNQTKMVAEVIDGITEQGANIFSGVSFIVGDPEKAQEKALEKALVNAKNKAQKMARKTGVELGDILQIREDRISPVYRGQEMMAHSMAKGMPKLPAGETEVKASVFIVYEIK